MPLGSRTTNSKRAYESSMDKVAELERELLQTQERLETALEALEATHNEASVGTWEFDIATGKVHWSDRLKEMLGIADHDPSADDDILSRIHPDNVEHW